MDRKETLTFALAMLGVSLIAIAAYQYNSYTVSTEQAKATLELLASNPAFAAAGADAATQATTLANRIGQTTLNGALLDGAIGLILILVALFIAPDKNK